MLSEIGQITLWLASAFAFTQGISGLMGGRISSQKWWGDVCCYTSRLHFICITVSFFVLMYAYIVCDFSLLNVFLNDHTKMPWMYRFCAVWGNHEGSLLLWSTTLGVMSFSLSLHGSLHGSKKKENAPFFTLTLGIQGIISTFFLLFLWIWCNPFAPVPHTPPEGLGLNPLLQDRSLMIHPPLLYIGYVGFSVPFSMALATLIRPEKEWSSLIHPWVLGAWSFLTLGIGWGSWWAYYELGWGGWWFWDPVENASLMPWLTGTALIHTLKVTQKQGGLGRWSLFLALTTFSLSLLGTFLVRSGVLSSVHSFAYDPERGFILFLILATLIGTGFSFWGWRFWGEAKKAAIFPLSKEGGLVVQSLFFVAAMLIIALGTFYPLILEAFAKEQVSIGAPYFNAVLIPFMTVPLSLMPIIPFLSWKKGDIPQALKELSFAGTFSLGGLLFIWTLWDFPSLFAGLEILLALWIGSGALSLLQKRKQSQNTRSTPSFYGMILAHLGVAICLAGLAGGSFWRVETEKVVAVGNSFSAGPYILKLAAVTLEEGPNFKTSRAALHVSRGADVITTLMPERRLYDPQEVLLSETAIYTTGFSDLYVVLGAYFGKDLWQLKAYYSPLVPWIWFGVIAMFAGGMLCLCQRLKRG